MEQEPRPRFNKTELAQISSNPFAPEHIFYSAMQYRYKGRVFISQSGGVGQVEGDLKVAKVYLAGGSDLPEIKKEIQISRFAFVNHGLSPIITDIAVGNWRALLLLVQGGDKAYFKSKDLKNVTSKLSQREAVSYFLTACDLQRERSGIPQEVEAIYRGYSSQTSAANPEALAWKVKSVVSGLIYKKAIAA